MSRVRSRVPLALLAALALAASSCDDPASPELVDLEQARERWAERGSGSYDFEFRQICFCGPTVPEPVLVSVRSGQIASVRSVATGAQVTGEPLRAYYTIDGLFDLLEGAARQGADGIQAEYDRELGYPTSVFIDYSQQTADEEYGWRASALVLR